MRTYLYRIYLDGAMFVDERVTVPTVTHGQQLLEARYPGRRVVWMGG